MMNNIEIGPFGPSADTTGYQPYDTALPAVFAGIKSIILEAMPDASVEHVGSSSIPGVGGRNVVDIALPCALEVHDAIRIRLKALGFEDSPFPHYLPLLVASAHSNGRNYPILLYVIDPNDIIYRQWVQFRDYMRLHPEDAQAYDEVKRRAVADGHGEDGSYQEAKTPFIVSLMGKIQADDR